MADKYLIQGATYCGDGTASNEAASAGATGAWNNINVFEGTAPAYGALVAGDVVYIRSKTSAGVDISVSKSAATTLGVAAATELAPITWIFDAGVVWSGVSGVVTYTMTTANTWTVRNYNNLLANNYNFVLKTSSTSMGNMTFCSFGTVTTQSVKLDCTATASSTGPSTRFSGGVHTDLWIRQGSVTYGVVYADSDTRDTVLISPKIEVLGPLYFPAAETRIFITSSGHSGGLTVFGGALTGAVLSGVSLVGATAPCGNFGFYGFRFPASMVVSNANLYVSKHKTIINGSDGLLGNVVYDYACEYSSRFDGFYPTLNARLETSAATPWAYRLHTYRTTPQNPAQVAVSKLWTQDAAIRKVALEILWPTAATSSFAAPTKDKVWITVQYTDDATGSQVFKSGRLFDGSTLAASSAAWSASTYGATNFDKYKLELTTPSSVRKDTDVLVNLFVIPRASSPAPLDIIMICPDPVLSAP